MIPTITDVRNWKPAVLHDRAQAVDTVAAHLDDERGALTDTARTLWQSWQGHAADAAEKHLDRERRSVVAVVEHLRHVGDQLRRADTALTWSVLAVRNAIANAERAGFTVDDSGVKPGRHADDSAAATSDAAAEHAEAIRRALVTLGELDDHYADILREIVADLAASTPKPAPLSPDEAVRDRAIFDDGKLDDDEVGRLLANLTAAGLDTNSLADLAAGRQVTHLPAGAIRYLEELYHRGGVEQFLLLQNALGEDGSPQAVAAGRALSAGILTLSNESIVDDDGHSGGWDRLPPDVRALVQLNPADSAPATLDDYLRSLSPFERSLLEADPGAAARAHAEMLRDPGNHYAQRLGVQNEFWERVAASDGIPGTRLGVELVESAATQVGLSDSTGRSAIASASYAFPNGLGEAMLDVGTRNNETNARILTGELDGDGSPETRRDAVLTPLFVHEWNDDGASLGRLTSWMTEESLAVHGPGDTGSLDTERRDRADRAALGLAQYLSHGENYSRFMDMSGPDTSNLGEVNPALLHATSQGLVGYIPHLSGIDTDSREWGYRAAESSDAGDKRFAHAQRVFALMSTGTDANTTFMGGALAFHETYDRAFVRSLLEPDKWGEISPDTAAAGNAAHIQALVDTGIYGAAVEQSRDQENIANTVAERRNQAYDTGYTMMRNAVASFVPANFTVGMTMDMLNPSVRDTFTIPETPTENFAFTMNESLVTAENDVRIARLLVGTNWEPQSPSAIDGLTKAGILAEDGTLSPDPHPLADRSSQRVHTFIASAIETEFGIHHFDRYSDEYRRSYHDVAPTVHFTSTN
ncbi:WXG100 family type VII secretion target [Rhodococcus sp. (in: high G+C Gram-positive bacteria)]|uniref:WXG100 family type VII secretion target n=1 Tax=Rhodococcus sp. TaxID=1831 RepID=UPI00388ECC22